MTIRAIVVDDEPTARRTLQNLIENYTDGIEVIATAEDVLSGVKIINKENPDLVFLDVRMPNYSGFSLIDYFDELNFKIIFTTAYEEYAQQALIAGASGYLLKPIDIDDLVKAVEKVKEEILFEQNNFLIKDNKSLSFNKETGMTTLPSVSGILKLNTSEILYIEAKGRQVSIFLIDGKNVLANLSMKSILELFRETTFIRIHKSYIVNFIHIKKYAKGKDSHITLYNDINLDVGKVFKDGINEIISYLPK